jgi:hypothetical protein
MLALTARVTDTEPKFRGRAAGAPDRFLDRIRRALVG